MRTGTFDIVGDLDSSTEDMQMWILHRGLAAIYLSGTATIGSLFLLCLPEGAAAQGLPVETGSHLPVALWLGGAVVLGIAIAYGILRTRSRTSAERRMTDQATKDLYVKENRDAN
ncbi:hypothetical protein [Bradyrhizobium sp. OAE829]|uniref:hypothetical protein n=1 Tax=Bradyrhizobium sp. OAE829 TaxID=2663807 RepID=UPI0019E02743